MFKTKRINDYVLELDAGDVGNSGWTHKTLAMFDQHFDNDKFRKDLMEGGLKKAKDEGRPIFFGGDFFDVMQTRHDPRRARGGNGSEKAKYLNYICEEAVEFLTPYASNIFAWFMGNHETVVLKNSDFDIVRAIIEGLKYKTSHQIEQMNYTGYLVYKFNSKSSNRGKRKIWVHHGYGGNAPATKGVLNVGRRAAAYPCADILVTGHTHECWAMPHAQEMLSNKGIVQKRVQWHVQIPSMKDETKNKKGIGWGIEKGFNPQVNGFAWLKFERVPKKNEVLVVATQPELELEYVR